MKSRARAQWLGWMCAAAGGLASAATFANNLPTWGTDEDVGYAIGLWEQLEQARLVGDDRFSPRPTRGEAPHGSVQQITAANIDGPPGGDLARLRVVVKANHRGEGITPETVYEDPNHDLTGYAVMAKRAPGYDPANADWFWVTFNVDGTVRISNNRPLAGRIDTGTDAGCIGCHRKYGGLTRQ